MTIINGKKGILAKALEHLIRSYCVLKGDGPSPSRVALDSQSVKSVSFVNQYKGIDGNKYVNAGQSGCRKRHIAVDKYGLPLAVHVSAANCHDSPQGIELLWQSEKYERVELCCVDDAYHGTFEECIKLYEWKIEFGRGHLVENQKAVRGLSHKMYDDSRVGQSKEALLGSTFIED